jgi:hypothetical protein
MPCLSVKIGPRDDHFRNTNRATAGFLKALKRPRTPPSPCGFIRST